MLVHVSVSLHLYGSRAYSSGGTPLCSRHFALHFSCDDCAPFACFLRHGLRARACRSPFNFCFQHVATPGPYPSSFTDRQNFRNREAKPPESSTLVLPEFLNHVLRPPESSTPGAARIPESCTPTPGIIDPSAARIPESCTPAPKKFPNNTPGFPKTSAMAPIAKIRKPKFRDFEARYRSHSRDHFFHIAHCMCALNRLHHTAKIGHYDSTFDV